jgi:hypothetical protein
VAPSAVAVANFASTAASCACSSATVGAGAGAGSGAGARVGRSMMVTTPVCPGRFGTGAAGVTKTVFAGATAFLVPALRVGEAAFADLPCRDIAVLIGLTSDNAVQRVGGVIRVVGCPGVADPMSASLAVR